MKCSWINTDSGPVLVQPYEYEGVDTMPAGKPIVLGGLYAIPDPYFSDGHGGYFSGWVMKDDTKLVLNTRFDPAKAQQDVYTRLKEMGYNLEILTPDNHE